MLDEQIKISWFGRCCFLVEINNRKVLFDPYDTYCHVDIGQIEADLLISSSTWHDHGHIGASPNAWIFSYPGVTHHSDFQITGIEAKENRGTPTVIFNLQFKSFSITNFADFGPAQSHLFDQNLSAFNRQILLSTNIAFIRPSILEDKVKAYGENLHIENALNYCQPTFIIPEHYFPRSFIQDQVEQSKKELYSKPNILIDEMIDMIGYPVKEIDGYSVKISEKEIGKKKTVYRFLKLHPQVKYHEGTYFDSRASVRKYEKKSS